MIQNMKPDRIQFGPPINDDLSWAERTPSLTRTFDFDHVRDAALFLIYADGVAGEIDEIRVTQNLYGRNLTMTVKPVSADYLPHAVYEFAAMIDATVEALRRPRPEVNVFEADELDLDDFDDLDDFEADDDLEDDDDLLQ